MKIKHEISEHEGSEIIKLYFRKLHKDLDLGQIEVKKTETGWIVEGDVSEVDSRTNMEKATAVVDGVKSKFLSKLSECKKILKP